jgi:hypothetical protein
VTFGLVIPDVPQALMAWWPKAKVGKMEPSDFWFVRGDVWWVGKEDLLITEVMYEPDGPDADLEYVEICNPTAQRVDLNGWQLRDNVGSWTINAERDIPPGKHMVVTKKGEPFNDKYGVAWDFEGMTLNLNNDGDRLQLLDPRGKEVDKVAWEGVDGWSVVAEKGEALLRDELVEDSGTQAEWYYGPPSPGEANA